MTPVEMMSLDTIVRLTELTVGMTVNSAKNAVKTVTNIRTIFSQGREPEYNQVTMSGRTLYQKIKESTVTCPECGQNSWKLHSPSHLECRVCYREFHNYGSIGLEPIRTEKIFEK